MTKQEKATKPESVLLGLNNNTRENSKLKKRNKEIVSFLRQYKASQRTIKSAVVQANKVAMRLNTVLKKATTLEILKTNPKAKLKTIPSIPKVTSKNEVMNTVFKSDYVSNVIVRALVKEFNKNEARKVELKAKRKLIETYNELTVEAVVETLATKTKAKTKSKKLTPVSV